MNISRAPRKKNIVEANLYIKQAFFQAFIPSPVT